MSWIPIPRKKKVKWRYEFGLAGVICKTDLLTEKEAEKLVANYAAIRIDETMIEVDE